MKAVLILFVILGVYVTIKLTQKKLANSKTRNEELETKRYKQELLLAKTPANTQVILSRANVFVEKAKINPSTRTLIKKVRDEISNLIQSITKKYDQKLKLSAILQENKMFQTSSIAKMEQIVESGDSLDIALSLRIQIQEAEKQVESVYKIEEDLEIIISAYEDSLRKLVNLLDKLLAKLLVEAKEQFSQDEIACDTENFTQDINKVFTDIQKTAEKELTINLEAFQIREEEEVLAEAKKIIITGTDISELRAFIASRQRMEA